METIILTEPIITREIETITLTEPIITREVETVILTEPIVTIRTITREIGTIETIIEEETCLIKRKNQTS